MFFSRTVPRWFSPRLATVLLGALLAACGDSSSPQAAAPSTAAPAGSRAATAEAVALILDNKDRCLKIARGGMDLLPTNAAIQDTHTTDAFTWSRLYSPFSSYIQSEAAQEATDADTVNRVVIGLIPEVRRESADDVADAVDGLMRAEEALCRTARHGDRSTLPLYAQDADSREAYKSRITQAVDAFTLADTKLAPLFAVTEAEYQAALAKHRSRLASTAKRPPASGTNWQVAQDPGVTKSAEERARQETEWKEYLRRSEQEQVEHQAAISRLRREGAGQAQSLPKLGALSGGGEAPATTVSSTRFYRDYPGPVNPSGAPMRSGPDLPPDIKAWYATYLPRATAVDVALARYRQARTDRFTLGIAPACHQIHAATSRMLGDARALTSPDETLNRLLRTAQTELQALADACIEGQDADAHLAAADQAFAGAAEILKPYRLRP